MVRIRFFHGLGGFSKSWFFFFLMWVRLKNMGAEQCCKGDGRRLGPQLSSRLG